MSERKWAYLASVGLGDMPVRRVAAELAAIGYRGIELTLAHFNPAAMDPAALERAAQDVAAEGLAISELVVQQDWVTRDETQRSARIDLTMTASEPALTAASQPSTSCGPRRGSPAAPKLGVTSPRTRLTMAGAAMERSWLSPRTWRDVAPTRSSMVARDYYTTAELPRRVPSSGSESTWTLPLPALLERCAHGRAEPRGPHVHVHLKALPACRRPAATRSCSRCWGGPDWPAFAALDEIGYDGFCSVEFESFKYFSTVLAGDGLAAARLSMEQLRRLEG